MVTFPDVNSLNGAVSMYTDVRASNRFATNCIYQQTSADAANVVALQAELANARAELDRQKTHDTKQVSDLKRAIDWTQEARDTMEKRLERSQLAIKQRERTWAATEAHLKERKEDAIVDAAAIQEKLKLTILDHKKQVAKAQKEKRNLDELLKKKSISMETIESKLQSKLKIEQTKIESSGEKQEMDEDELTRTQADYKARELEVNQTKSILKEERSNLLGEERGLKDLKNELQSVKQNLAAKKAANLELEHSVKRLEKDIAEENKLADHFRSAEESFQLVREKVNRTMEHVKDERQHALLISQDLLKVRVKHGLFLTFFLSLCPSRVIW